MRKWFLLSLAVVGLSGFEHQAAVFRQPANVVGEVDGRGPVIELAPALGFTASEIEAIRSAVGYVICPGTKHKNPANVSGFLVAPDVVVTVAHAFYDESGRERGPFKDCYFQSMGERAAIYSLREGTVHVGSRTPVQNRGLDYALFKLLIPVKGARPLTVLNPAPPLAPGEPLYPTIAFRESRYKVAGESPHEPLIQLCHARRHFPGGQGQPPSLYSDCDNTPGGSGGPNLVRVNGRLAVAGIFVGAGFAAQDFKPYYDQPAKAGEPSRLSLSYTVLADGPFLALIHSALKPVVSSSSSLF